MSDAFETMMISLLNDANWRETVSYVPAGGTEADRVEAVHVLIRRDEPTIRNEKDRFAEHRFYLKVLKTVDATHKGILSPAIGDKWKLPLARQTDGADPEDGSYLDGWMAGAPRAARGHWLIPVTKRIYETTGGKRLAEGG